MLITCFVTVYYTFIVEVMMNTVIKSLGNRNSNFVENISDARAIELTPI